MTYILDTNVLSEIMRETPHPSVVDWLRRCLPDAMRTTSICQAEILYGIRRLPEGQRRRDLQRAAETMFARTFAERILGFDSRAAAFHADIRTGRERMGRPITAEDSMIAAIAAAASMTVVTRDHAGFAECGVAVIDPWQ